MPSLPHSDEATRAGLRPVLLTVRGRELHSYPCLLYLGSVAGTLAAAAAAPDDLAARVAFATTVLIVPALVGSRLMYVLTHRGAYRGRWRLAARRDAGGGAMYGGLILALPLSVPLLRVLDIPLRTYWDAAVFALLVGMIFTRAGCLLHGCCRGTRRIPTSVLEAALACVLLAGAVALHSRVPFDGALFLGALAAYATGRFALDFTRVEPRRRPTVAQATSVCALLGTLLVLAVWLN
ncbi:MAG: phosphatidylglycerol---prolipoprotein diacylglyceryl transferase [Gaiellaceae bacterium]|nr:phosphatidylglycerol---prolipoprotein diacylglyceryl transferase [Gaiellaceae bacterium]MDX6478480.1 phosphatidylglycerol---prolipoprotein diacylglyceryl transferase [Gaiellaceae bacterium]MDX6487946.1 phosphatidylglycerol---prolipoprotein diacylglyceryl transferase [Gaiellaceae bacterium]